MGGQYIEPMPTAPPGAAAPRRRWSVPRPCVLCSQWGPGGLCTDCHGRFADAPVARCPRCALPQVAGAVCGACLRVPPPFDRCTAAVDYAFPWDRLVSGFKFNGHTEWAALLADVLGQALVREQRPGDTAASLVLPVPLSPARLRERGYNQAWELARRLAARQRLPAQPQWLQRLRDTPHQVGLSRVERERNLHDAMWVPPQGRAGVAGRHVALVDDVMTTGMTAAAAARALKAVGAASVQVWVVARTPAPDP